MTTFNDQLFQMGGIPVPLGGGAIYQSPYTTSRNGRTWYVDPNYGSDGNAGNSWNAAYETMQAAFDSLASGDTIYFTGKITEQLVTPVQVFDVSVIGAGNRPRHADSTPAGGQYASAQWAPPSSGVAAQATVRVLQQGWRFQNILFTMYDTNAAGVEIVRNAASGDSERDASHCVVTGCRFAGAGVGVRMTATSFTENPFNCLIANNDFNGNTISISATAAQPNMIQILNNRFMSNTTAITAKLQASLILGNFVGIFTASGNAGGIDLRNGGGNNKVFGNYLGGAFSNAGGYNGESGDNWWGNFADVSGGVTQADPA